MTGPGVDQAGSTTRGQKLPGPPDPSTRTATRTAAATVTALAIIAAAISYDHMRHLAETHGETGWRAHTFPLSVDGLEIIATLVLIVHHRAHRVAGWLPWLTLTVGAAASVIANIAEAPPNLIARIIAGWPALALTAAIKLLATMLDQPTPTAESPKQHREQQPRARLPTTATAVRAWQQVWNDHLTTSATATELAARHHISDRQARAILAAGRNGNLDTVAPEPAAGQTRPSESNRRG